MGQTLKLCILLAVSYPCFSQQKIDSGQANPPTRTSTQRASKTATSPSGKIDQPMYVAFSFSSPGLHNFGGDGAWGAAVDKNKQAAIESSASKCVSKSSKPDSCGTGNGGSFQVCRSDGTIRWVALAINNDGTAENWADGEGIGYTSQAAAEQAAVANCNHAGCHVVWEDSVACGEQKPATTANCVQVSGRLYPGTDINNWALTNGCGQEASALFLVDPKGPFHPQLFRLAAGQTNDTQIQTGWHYKLFTCVGHSTPTDVTTGKPADWNTSQIACK